MTLTLSDIRHALSLPRPGLRGQQLMAPGYRPLDQKSYDEGSKTCRRAAVLLLLYPRGGQLYTVLTQRRHDLPDHPGQIAFPGGSRDGQETVAQTALREAQEEVGVEPDRVEVLGRLTHIYIPPSHFCIQIVVGYAAEPPAWRPNPDEVEALIEVPISRFLDPAARQIAQVERDGRVWAVPYFDLDGHKVWGATAMALGEFVTLLREALPEKTRPPFPPSPIHVHAVTATSETEDFRPSRPANGGKAGHRLENARRRPAG